jgi:hypothetical protein
VCGTQGREEKHTERILVRKRERKRPLEILCMDERIMDPKEVGWKGMNWFLLPQDGGKWQETMDVVMCLWVP